MLRTLAAFLLWCLIANLAGAELPLNLSGNFRAYYFNRTFVPLQESLAAGGWLDYNSPAWRGINLNLAGYTSQGLIFTDPAHGGGGLLTPSQAGFSVLGKANVTARSGGNQISLYRQELNTPFINAHDLRMVPKLFEALNVQAQPDTRTFFQAAHVAKIKGWADTDFVPMSQFAGLAGTDQGVTLAGLLLSPTDRLKIQAWNYYCWDFMNVAYLQSDARFAVQPGLDFVGSAQTFIQNSVGQAIGGDFYTGVLGLKGAWQWASGIKAVLAYTNTSLNHDIVNPKWGSYAGFTSIVEEDCDLAGEQAWTAGVENNFIKLYHTQAFITGRGSFAAPSQFETDLLLEYKLTDDYSWQLRGASVSNGLDMGGLSYSNVRIIVNRSF